MKLGILGTGMIVKDMLTMIDQLSIEKIILLGTKSTQEETKELALKYQLEYCFDYDELLRSDIDTIYVALPNHLHYQFAKKALQNHKHVIIEKPITSNTKELHELIDLAKQNQLIILEAMNIHYLPAFQMLKKEINKIGQLKIMNFNYSQYSSRYDAFKQGQILPAFDYKKSGGALMDIHVYNIHAIIGLFGKPQHIHYLANIENQIDTSGIMTWDYGTFKVVSIGAKDCRAPIMSTLQGDKGVINIEKPVNQMTAYDIIDNAGMIESYQTKQTNHRLYYEFSEFVRIINELDYTKCNEMLEISQMAAEVMEDARKAEGIVFENDR